MVPLFLVAAALAVQPAAPAANPAADQAAAPAAKAAPVKRADQTVCRKQAPLGSQIPREVCLTRKEWAAIDREARDDAMRTRDYEIVGRNSVN